MSNNNFQLGPRLLNGAIAATIGAATVFPLDLVKTRLQNQHIGPGGEREYSSMFDCFKKTVQQDGIRGLYRGLAVNILWVGPEKGVKLAANDFFRNLLSSDRPLTLIRQALAGAGAGAIQVLVSCPTELLKIQVQDSGRVAAEAKQLGQTVERTTALGVTRKLIHERGFLGLYKGVVPTAYRDILFAIIYFPFFAFTSSVGPKKPDGEPFFYWNFLSGIAAGAVSAWVVTPFDVLKTRLQAIAKSGGQKVYSGMLDCFTHTMSTEGITAFFKGGACRIIVIAPLYGIAQSIYYIGVAERILGIDVQKSIK